MMINVLQDLSIKEKVIKALREFTKASPTGSVTTGMLMLLIKPSCSTEEFSAQLDDMENHGLLISMPKGKTKRWRLS